MSNDDRPVIESLWPHPAPSLDDDALLAAYAMPGRPALRVNFVASVDGAATIDGKSGQLSGPADKRVFDLLRVRCDGVMVGAGTLRAEGYGPMRVDDHHQAMRRATNRAPHPTLVVVSNSLDLDPAHPMFVDAPVRPWVVTTRASPVERREALAAVASVLVSGESAVDMRGALAALADAGIRHVLCEGGPHLFGALVAADAVDETCLTISSRLAGAGAGRIIAGPPGGSPDLHLAHVLRSEASDLFLRYSRPVSTGSRSTGIRT